MESERLLKQFNWRFLLVRIIVNAFALAGTAAFIPKIYFTDRSIGNWLLMTLMLGVLNALLKPILQFLTLQFIFITYGLVVVVVNALLLWLLSLLFPNRFVVENLLWLLIGGLVLGLLSSFLESLLGLTMPIVPGEPPELRLQVEEQARQVEWLAVTPHGAVPSLHVSKPEPNDLDAGAAQLSTPELDERLSSSADVQAPADPNPAEEPLVQKKEDPS